MISLCMIVKNEELFLEKCLQSALEYFDDIVVLDTGSTDRTREIALNYNARIYDFVWINDFSAARNHCAAYAKHDWIFVLDADESIISFDNESIQKFMRTHDSGTMQIGSVTCLDANISDDNPNEIIFITNTRTRLYNRKHFIYTGKIHEQISPINTGTPYDIRDIPITLKHDGYLPEAMQLKNKLLRNRMLLQDELLNDPNNPYLLYQLGKTYFSKAEDNDKACELFEKALAQKPKLKLEYVYSLVECYGYSLLNSGRYKESLKILEYNEHYKHNPNFRFLLAHIYQNNAMLIEAVSQYESCIGQPGSISGIDSYLSYYNIAVILEVVGMTEQAIQYYLKCGDYAPAVKRLSAIQPL